MNQPRRGEEAYPVKYEIEWEKSFSAKWQVAIGRGETGVRRLFVMTIGFDEDEVKEAEDLSEALAEAIAEMKK